MNTTKSLDPPASWPDRERAWARRLGRIKLGVEPVEEQLERIRRVNLAMTYVCGGIEAIFAAIFVGFGHPGIALILIAILSTPPLLARAGFVRLERRVNLYLRERAEAKRMEEGDFTADDADSHG